jgi:CBS domain-containing protein
VNISEVLQGKGQAGPAVVTVTTSASVSELLRFLAEHNVGALVVSDDGTTVQGIVSERDIVRALDREPDSFALPVSAIMTADVTTCAPDASVNDLRHLMTDKRIRHVPVVEGDRLVGIVSIGDIVKSSIGQLEFERAQLESYIRTAG